VALGGVVGLRNCACGGGGRGLLWLGTFEIVGRRCTVGIEGGGCLGTLGAGLRLTLEGGSRGALGGSTRDASESDGIFVWKLNVGLGISGC
jgi:hypothetical protein